MLTKDQKKVALFCKYIRPATLPGTNAIPNDSARMRWYESVNKAMVLFEIEGADVEQFCDIAGVSN